MKGPATEGSASWWAQYVSPESRRLLNEALWGYRFSSSFTGSKQSLWNPRS